MSNVLLHRFRTAGASRRAKRLQRQASFHVALYGMPDLERPLDAPLPPQGPAVKALLFEALEQRILLSADHTALTAALLSSASIPATQAQLAAPTIDVASTTKATTLDALVKPSGTALATIATVPGSQIQEQTFTGDTTSGTDSFVIPNVLASNTLSVLIAPSHADFQGVITLTDPYGTVVAKPQDPSQPLLISPLVAQQYGDYHVTIDQRPEAKGAGAGAFTATVATNATLNQNLATRSADYHITDLTPSDTTLPEGGDRMAAVGQIFTPAGSTANTVDGYDVTASKGDVLDITAIATSTTATGVTIDLYGPQGEVADGANNTAGTGQSLDHFVVPADGTYTINVFGLNQAQVDYNLIVTKNAGFKIGSSPDAVLSPSGNSLGHLDDAAPNKLIKVAVEGNAGGAAVVSELNAGTRYAFDATLITSDAVKAGGLAGYDAVVLADTPQGAVDDQAFIAAVEAFQQAGGGVLTLPPVAGGIGNSDAAVGAGSTPTYAPIDTASAVTETGTTVATDSTSSPIVAGIGPIGSVTVTAGNALNGLATTLATTSDGGIAVAALQPTAAGAGSVAGRAVYLGLAYDDSSNTALRSGSADVLLSQAVAWVAARPDGYLVNLNAGDAITINATQLRQNEDGLADTVEPRLFVIDPKGQAVAVDTLPTTTQSAGISFTAGLTGTYRLLVAAQDDTAGDYSLGVTGATGAPTLPTAVATNPLNGTVVPIAPTSIDIHFSEPLLLGSLTAGALTVNGVAATDLAEHGGQDYTFTIDPSAVVADGSNTVAVAAGSATGIDGLPLAASYSFFGVGTLPAATVATSSISEGQTVPGGAPVTETVTFSAPMVAADLANATLVNTSTGTSYAPTGITYDPASFTATFTYPALQQSPFEAYTFTLPQYAIHDVYGSALDADYKVDFTVGNPGPLAVTLAATGPAGAGVYATSTNGVLGAAGTANLYTFSALPGQTLGAAATATAGVGLTLTLTDSTGTVVASASGTALASLLDAPLAGGAYALAVTSTADYAPFALSLALNADVDAAADADAGIGTAFALTGSSEPVGATGDRLAAVGTIDAADDAKTYAFTLQAGQSATLLLGSTGASSPTLTLLDSSGAAISVGSTQVLAGAGAIDGFVAPSAGTYYAQVSGSAGSAYTLVVTRGAQIATAPTDGPQALTTGAILGTLRPEGGTGPLRVAVYASAALGNASQAVTFANALNANTEYAITATVVTGSDIDTVAKLQGYDVVLLADRDLLANYAPFAPALQAWVQQDGGSVVAAGSVVLYPLDVVQTAAEQPTLDALNAILPITLAPGIQSAASPSITAVSFTATDPASPITAGGIADTLKQQLTSSFLTGQVWDAAASIVLTGTNNQNTVPAVGTIAAGAGRSVYLDFSYPDITYKLLQQSLAYAANVGNEFTIQATAGTPLTVTTQLPVTGTAPPVSSLVPSLELIAPDGTIVGTNTRGAADGTNALLSVQPTVTGLYRLRVTGAGSGDVTVNVTGASTAAPPFTVAKTFFPSGTVLQDAGALYPVSFSANIDLRTLAAGDLTIDGVAATGFTVVDGRTVDFETGSTLAGEGTHVIAIAAGALKDVAGVALAGFSATLKVDRTSPTIVSTSLDSGTIEPASPLEVTVTFSEPMDPRTILYYSGASLTEVDADGNYLNGNNASLAYYDADTLTATYLFPRGTQENTFDPSREGLYQFTLSGQASDLAGNIVAGDPASGPGSSFTKTVTIDNTLLLLPALVSAPPSGSLIAETTANGAFSGPGDVDEFAVDLPAGDTVGITLAPRYDYVMTGQAAAQLELVDASQSVVATASAVAGATATIVTTPNLSAGHYTIRLTDTSGSGAYQLRVVTNALLDAPTPASLEPSSQAVATGGDRLAAAGTLGTSQEDDYTFALAAGQTATVALGYADQAGLSSSGFVLTLIDPNGSVVATGSTASEVAQQIAGYTAATAGIYKIEVTGPSGQDYHLVVTRGLDLYRNENQVVPVGGSVLGALGPTTGTGRPIRTLVYGNDAATQGFLLSQDSTFVVTTQPVGTITSVTQLQSYDLVVLATTIGDAMDPAFAKALHAWVETDGGSLVVTGSSLFWAGISNPDITAVLPLDISSPADVGQGEVDAQPIDDTNPIVAGVTFRYGFGSSEAYAPAAAGAQVIAASPFNSNQTVVTTATVGLGRSVFIGFNDALLIAQASTFAAGTGTANNYTLVLTAGASIEISTTTPVGGAGAAPNALAPTVQLVGPDGTIVASSAASAADGRNVDFTYTVPETGGGAYSLRVLNYGTATGAYVLTVAPASGSPTAGQSAVRPTSLTGPSALAVGQTAEIGWTVLNGGPIVSDGPWTDELYLSATPTLDADAVLIASVDHDGPLDAGDQYNDQVQIILPNTVAAGSYYLILKTTGSDTDPASQTLTTIVSVTKDVTAGVTAPTAAVAGQAASFGITLTPTAATALNRNVVFLTTDPNNPLGGTQLGVLGSSALIPAGQSITQSASLTIPDVPAGTYYVAVESIAQVGGQQTVHFSFAPQTIVIGKVQVGAVTAPATTNSDEPATLAWTLTNPSATTAVVGKLVDTVYLATDAAGDNLTQVASFEYDGGLAAGQTLARSQSVTPPPLPAGTYYFVVTTTLNGIATTTAVAATPTAFPQTLPNLVVSAVTPPASLASGQPATIRWTVSNTGTGPTGATAWVDDVYLSATAVPDANSILLGAVANQASLDPGDGYSSALTATLPQGISGAYYIIVVADAAMAVPENIDETDNTTAAPVTVALTPPPDLQVASVTGPATAFSGQSANVSWTVQNHGQGSTVATEWFDDLYLSKTPALDATAVLLSQQFHGGALDAGQGYTGTAAVTLPIGISGPYYFIVVTDAGNQVYEQNFEGNNITPSSVETNILLTPPPDLVSTITSAPAAGLAGGAIQVAYAVSNAGSTVTPNTVWTDNVYVSQSQTLDSSAILIGSQQHFGALVPGDSYTNTETYMLPNGIAGSYYVLVDTDATGAVFELAKANNVAASAIAVTSDPAAFAVTAVTAPSQGATGRAIVITYSVVNNGGDTQPVVGPDGVPIGEHFADSLVLTRTGSDGKPVSTTVGTFYNTGLIAHGAGYTNTEVVTLPYIPAGPYTLTVVADSDGSVYQSPATNSTSAPQSFTLMAAGPDLAITGVSTSSPIQAGTPATVSWTTSNIGSNPTDANVWYDNVYLSTKSVLDGSATLLGSYRHSSALAAGASATASFVTTLPIGLATGSYTIFVEADSAHSYGFSPVTAVTDIDRTNNVGASGPIAVTANPHANDVPDLMIGAVTADATVVAGQNITVGWTVTNTGAAPASQAGYDAVYLSLDGTLDKASDIYLGSYQAFDAASIAPGGSYTASQTFTVPPGLAGAYHVIVDVDAGGANGKDPNTANNIGVAPVAVTAPQPVDLAIVAGTIAIPADAVAGMSTTFSYDVTNLSGNAATGSWTDSLYLSATGTFDPADPLLGTVVHTGGLAAGGTYTGTLQAPLPGVTPGNYYVIVRTNILDAIPETTLANNIAASLDTTSIDIPALTLGVPVTGSLSQGQATYYKVTVAAGQALSFDVAAPGGFASTAVYVKFGAAPTPNDFDLAAATPFTADQSTIVPTTQAGTYYVEVLGQNNVGSYTLTAAAVPFSVTSVTSGVVGNLGNATVKVTGALFSPSMSFDLVGADGTDLQAVGIDVTDASTAYVTFAVVNATPQVYSLVATTQDGSSAATFAHAVTIVPGTGFSVGIDASAPPAVRVDKPASYQLNYANTGDQDMAAPLFIVSSQQALVFGIGDGQLRSGPIFVLGASTDGPADILRPGESQGIGVTFEAQIGQHYRYTIEHATYVSTDIGYDISDADWTTIEQAVRPDGLTDAQWTSFFANMKPQLGTNWGDFDSALNTLMKEVSPASGPLRDVRAIFGAAYALSPTFTPYQTITGRLLSSVDGTTPLAGIQLYAVLQTPQGPDREAVAVTAADGTFTFAGLKMGAHLLSIEDDYAFDAGRDGTQDYNDPAFVVGPNAAQTPMSAMTFYAAPYADASDSSQAMDPILVTDTQGISHLFWMQSDQLWTSMNIGGTWQAAIQVPGISGTNDVKVAVSAKLIDGNTPGLIITYSTEDATLAQGAAPNSSDIYYVIGRLVNGAMQWSVPVDLTQNNVADNTPNVVVGNDGKVSVVYISANETVSDDADLYFRQVNVTSGSLTTAADVQQAEVAVAIASALPSIMQQINVMSLAGAIEPSAAPYINYSFKLGDYPFAKQLITLNGRLQVTGDYTKNADNTEVDIKANVKFEILGSSGGTRSTGVATDITYVAKWTSNGNCKNPEWDLTSATLDGTAGLKFQNQLRAQDLLGLAPTPATQLARAVLEFLKNAGIDQYVQESADLEFGSGINWTPKTDAPPVVPVGTSSWNGKIAFKGKIQAGYTETGQIFVPWLDRNIGAKLSLSVQVQVDATLTPSFSVDKIKADLYLEIGTPNARKLGKNADGTPITGGSEDGGNTIKFPLLEGGVNSDGSLFGSLPGFGSGSADLAPEAAATGTSTTDATIVANAPYGTGNNYASGGSMAVESDIADNFNNNSEAQIAIAPDGTIVAVWTEDDTVNGGSDVLSSTYNGTSWSTPTLIPGSGGNNGVQAITFDANGHAVIAWSHADLPTGLLADDVVGAASDDYIQALIDYQNSFDIYASTLVDGTWSTAQAVARLPNSDNGATLATVNGQTFLAWVAHPTGQTDEIMTALWNGSSFGAPTPIASGITGTHAGDGIRGSIDSRLTIGSVNGQATLFWSQNVSADTQYSTYSLFSSSFSNGAWSAATAFLPSTLSAEGGKQLTDVGVATSGASTADPAAAVAAASAGSLASLTPIEPDSQLANKAFGGPPTVSETQCQNDHKDPRNRGGNSGGDGGSTGGQSNSPHDPNDLSGPIGYGTENYVSASQPLGYRIDFENDATTGAAAQVVIVTTQLDPGFDPRTFRLTGFGFGDTFVPMDGSQAFYQGRVDLSATKGYDVDVTAVVDVTTGLVTWTFSTIDPATGQAPTANVGFLPPDDANGAGEGFVSYSVKAKAGDGSGTVVAAQARITFDTEEPIDTPTVTATLDAGAPTSTVAPLAATQAEPDFVVSWSGGDEVGGSGIATYTIYVSDDGGAYTPWISNVAFTTYVFNGEVGHSYAFYSLATDNAGNVEAAPAQGQASTTVAGTETGRIIGSVFVDTNGDGSRNPGESGLAGATVFLDTAGTGAYVSGDPTTLTGLDGSYSFDGLTPGSYGVGLVPAAGQSVTTGAAETILPVVGGQIAQGPSIGVFAAGSITGSVFSDPNDNGVRDSGETGLGGVTIFLDANNDGILETGEASTVTGNDGSYSFGQIGPGTYAIREIVPSGTAQTTQIAGAQQVTMTSAGAIAANAIGDVALASISGTVFNDLNGDGIQETGETGLAGWTVFIDANGDGTLDNGETSVVSGSGGNYTLGSLLPGTYAIDDVAPAGWVQTTPAATSGVAVSAADSAATDGADIKLVLPDATPVTANGAAAASLDPDNTLAAQLTSLDKYRSDPRFAGYDGTGLSVAVIDTGIDVSSPYFGVEQNGVATKVAFQYNFADGTTDGSDIDGHGSNVASIIAGNNGAYQGVAPGASLDDLRVYGADGTGNFGYVAQALQWVIDHYKSDHIAAVSMALGDGGNWATAMSRYGIGDELATLAADDVIVVAAAGNNFYTFDSTPGVSYPASDPNVIAVGAVWDGNYGGPWNFVTGATDRATQADQIASFSQRGPLVDTYAPGALLTGSSATGQALTLQGTSQAEAFITGVATLAQDVALGTLGRMLTPTEFARLLTQSGDAILDDATDGNVTPTGATVSRVDVEKLATMILTLGATAPTPPVATGPTTGSPGTGVVAAGSRVVTVKAGEALIGADLGNFQQGSISGTVFSDVNGNGIRDGAEPTLAGQTVFIDLAGTGTLAAGDPTTTTGSTGDYSFADLGPGSYRIGVVLPAGASTTTPSMTVTMTSGLAATVAIGEALPAPGIPTLTTLVDDTGVMGDRVTKDTAVTVAGSGPRGATIVLTAGGTTVVGLGVADSTTGLFSITTTALSNGAHSLTATATDPATGVTSAPSIAFAVTVDAIVPQGTSTPTTVTATTATFTLSFTEPLVTLAPSDLTLVSTGTAAGQITGLTGSNGSYIVTVGSLTGQGSLALALAPGAAAQDAAGNLAVIAASTAARVPPAVAADTLTLRVSGDSYNGAPQFIVKVDGVQVGGVQTATASHASGAYQDVTLTGHFGANSKAVTVTFLNDAYAGAGKDRNLYVTSLTYDGATYLGATAITTTGASTANGVAELLSNGTITFDLAPPIVAGPDSLTLRVSGDSYNGAPLFTVSVDGVQVGGVQMATASHIAGQYQDITLTGNFGSNPKAVTVTFLNDLYGGTSSTDRNLYVASLTFNGTVYSGATIVTTGSQTTAGGVAELPSNGSVVFTLAPPVIAGPDTLTLRVAGDSYKGAPLFTVSVDGVQIGGIQVATASHAAGQYEDVTLTGNFGTNPKTVTVKFLNDLYGGSASTDRNLYVAALTFNGVVYSGATVITGPGQSSTGGVAELMQNGSIVFSLTPPAPVGPDSLTLRVSGDSYNGPALFAVFVDGVQVGGIQSATAVHANGAFQDVTVTGSFGANPKAVTVKFLNDLYGGPTQDRNLYVGSLTLNGVTYGGGTVVTGAGQLVANGVVELTSNGAITFDIVPPQAVGPDTLTLRVSGDNYSGPALFMVFVDGVQVGGAQSTTAIHANGEYQDITLTGAFGTNPKAVKVTFLNDLYGGAGKDRNLYVASLTLNGTTYPGSLAITGTGQAVVNGVVELMSNGSITFDLTPPVVAGPDSLTLRVSGDSYNGAPLFTVSVDGVQVGGVQIVTAAHASGHYQDITLTGDFGANPKAVRVTFLNDLYGGTSSTDRNLYVASLTFNGVTLAGAAAQTGSGQRIANGVVALASNGWITFALPPVTAQAAKAQTLAASLAPDAILADDTLDPTGPAALLKRATAAKVTPAAGGGAAVTAPAKPATPAPSILIDTAVKATDVTLPTGTPSAAPAWLADAIGRDASSRAKPVTITLPGA